MFYIHIIYTYIIHIESPNLACWPKLDGRASGRSHPATVAHPTPGRKEGWQCSRSWEINGDF